MIEGNRITFANLFDLDGYTAPNGVPLSQSMESLGPDTTYTPVYVPSPHLDSRRGEDLVINATGIKEISAERQTLFNNYAWMRQQVLERVGEDTDDGMLLTTATLLSTTINALPTFLVYHRDYHYDPAQIPPEVSHMYRANAGILSAVSFMFDEFDEDGEEPVITSGEAVYLYADSREILVKQHTGEACAAPRKLIAETSDALFFGKGANPFDATIARLFPTSMQSEALIRYGNAYGMARNLAYNLHIYHKLREEYEGDQALPESTRREKLGEIEDEMRRLYDEAAAVKTYITDLLNVPIAKSE